MSINVARGV